MTFPKEVYEVAVAFVGATPSARFHNNDFWQQRQMVGFGLPRQ
jgi:hypothetical protein